VIRRRPGAARAAVGLACLVLAAAGVSAASAASLVLAEREREEAIRTGQRSVVSEAFGDEWRVAGAAGDSVIVFTPFHRLALAARQAAFRNEPLKPADQDRALGEGRDKLMLWALLHGSRAEFAQHLRPRLLAGAREIAPSRVQNERTAAAQPDGRFLARCVYWFPARELEGVPRLELVVGDADERPVARFPIDLTRMR
jgi:hypothetical protein